MGAYLFYTSQTIDQNAWNGDWIKDKAAQYFLAGDVSQTQQLSLLLNKKTLIVDDFSIYNMMAT